MALSALGMVINAQSL